MSSDVDKAIATISAWYTAERDSIAQRQRGGIMLGAVVYGRWYLDIFTDYCLPTILAPDNRKALQDACIVLYTNEEGRPRLEVATMAARDAGIEVEIHTLPAHIIAAHDRPFLSLAAAQQLLVIRAARAGAAFHQLAPDHGYSARYFPNLRRVGAIYRNVAHGGINVAAPSQFKEIERYRTADGSLAVPAKDLGTIGWTATHMCPMNGTMPDRMPDEHYQVWRARDRVMLFNCYANPAYMTHFVCRLLDTPTMTTGTLDCHTKSLFGADFYLPTIADDMAFVSMSNAVQGSSAANYTTLDVFLDRLWREVGGHPHLLVYYLRATEIAAAIDETAPTAEEVIGQQTSLVDMAEERARKAA